jgi:hypothetical protein
MKKIALILLLVTLLIPQSPALANNNTENPIEDVISEQNVKKMADITTNELSKHFGEISAICKKYYAIVTDTLSKQYADFKQYFFDPEEKVNEIFDDNKTGVYKKIKEEVKNYNDTPAE